jgi:hypothetical protein
MKAEPPLLIIFQRTLGVTVFLLLHLTQVAGRLRQKLQAEIQKQKIFNHLLKRDCLYCGGLGLFFKGKAALLFGGVWLGAAGRTWRVNLSNLPVPS